MWHLSHGCQGNQCQKWSEAISCATTDPSSQLTSLRSCSVIVPLRSTYQHRAPRGALLANPSHPDNTKIVRVTRRLLTGIRMTPMVAIIWSSPPLPSAASPPVAVNPSPLALRACVADPHSTLLMTSITRSTICVGITHPSTTAIDLSPRPHDGASQHYLHPFPAMSDRLLCCCPP